VTAPTFTPRGGSNDETHSLGASEPAQMSYDDSPAPARAKSPVRIARERLGITQAELAERAGVTWKTAQRWDLGTHRPGSIEVAQRVAEILEEPLDQIFPPDAHLNVRDARAKHPAVSPPLPSVSAFVVPDPEEVLATLRQARRRPVPAPRFAAAFAAVVIVGIVAAVLLSGSNRPRTPQATSSGSNVWTSAVRVLPLLTASVPRSDTPTKPTPRRRTSAHRRHQPRRDHSSPATRKTSVSTKAETERATSAAPAPSTVHSVQPSSSGGGGCSDFAALC
jgi:transcriptional regulator with XRE-family HTH domain